MAPSFTLFNQSFDSFAGDYFNVDAALHNDSFGMVRTGSLAGPDEGTQPVGPVAAAAAAAAAAVPGGGAPSSSSPQSATRVLQSSLSAAGPVPALGVVATKSWSLQRLDI